jgi:hypothetical protein
MAKPLSDWSLRLEAVPRSSSKVLIDVCDGRGRVQWSICRDLRDEDGRKDASEDIGAKFGLDPAEILDLLTTRWNEHREQQIAAAESAADAEPPATAVNYDDSQGFLCWLRQTMHGEFPVPLANFTARIVEQQVRDDGTERSTAFIVEGKLADGRPLPRGEVTAEQFSAMRWPVRLWGSQAVVHAGHNLADHARAAIQLLSGDPPTRVLYTHSGWRQIGDAWFYLHQGGAIGPQGVQPGIDVALPDALSGYVLPQPPEGPDLVKAIQASLGMLTDLAPDHVAFPVLAAVYRAVLASCDFAPHLHGPTGVFKSEIAGLAQQHYGAGLDARHLPASWSSTGNSLEALAHAAKDALLIVDDFAPHGSATDIQRFHREADRLVRAQGNRSGRGRMRPDGSLRPAKPPRGLILSTGEDVPRGQSLRARLFVIEVSPGDVNKARLSECQRDAAAELYAQAFAGYVRWLAARYQQVSSCLRQERETLRDKLLAEGQHPRAPSILADLLLGLQYLFDFAVEVGGISTEERDALVRRGWAALRHAAACQAEHLEAAEPCGCFLRLLAGALASGRAHVAGKNGNVPPDAESWGWRRVEILTRDGPDTRRDAQGRRIGWVDGPDVYLEPEASYAEAQELARHQGEALPVGSRTLWRRLRERGLLASWDDRRQRNTVRRSLAGVLREAIHVRVSTLFPTETSIPSTGHRPPGATASQVDSKVDGPVDGFSGNRLQPSTPTVHQNPQNNGEPSTGGRYGRSDMEGDGPQGESNSAQTRRRGSV